jgi:hypothetical protein
MVVLIASAINIDHVRRGRMGRDAFMEHQSTRYERYYAHPDLEEAVLQSLLLCGAFLVIYEVIAFNTLKIVTFISEAKPKTDGASAQ